jgi:N4-(beta-N-acetylglucosaminyl)-L-asparaginase
MISSPKKSRRNFLKLSALSIPFLSVKNLPALSISEKRKPIVISTWNNTLANEAAWNVLSNNGKALDAVEQGARIPEANPKDTSVGYGGFPDRDGKVTLDACIMNEEGNCGSVAFLEHIKHPISVARLVMEKTPHVMLVGEGALQFALSQGFKKENMLHPDAEKAWKRWLEKNQEYVPHHEPGQHDTIGILAIDDAGNLSGACSTSGMAYKMRGRLGDSPIIGAGLFVDNEIGAATATGVGEEMIRIAGSHTIVELMRNGRSPQQACEEAVMRVVKRHGEAARNLQVAFIALNNAGAVGAYCTTKGFQYTISTNDQKHVVVNSDYYFK